MQVLPSQSSLRLFLTLGVIPPHLERGCIGEELVELVLQEFGQACPMGHLQQTRLIKGGDLGALTQTGR